METLMIECVQSSLRLFMNRNAIFLCERLCAEFPTELNMQLLASCYLRNNQAYSAYHILKGTQMAQSRYLFAISCFQMDLLREAEAALCAANEPDTEVPNGAAGHYLLGLIYRYTDRRKSAVDHFMQALSIDPFLWSAYEELCILGAAEEANTIFGEAAALRIQQQYSHSASSSQNEESNVPSSRTLSSEDTNSRQFKQFHENNIKEILPGHPPRASGLGPAIQRTNCGPNMSIYNTPSPVPVQVSGVAPPPILRYVQPQTSAVGGEGSPKSIIGAAIQPPRRKFMDEGKLRKSVRSSSTRAAHSQVSGRLFSDSGPRRSTRLSGEAATATNSNVTQVAGNGTTHSSSKFLGGFSSSSKMSSATFRSVTIRKGQPWATESIDEGRQHEIHDDNATTSPTSVSASGDDRPTERERTFLHAEMGVSTSGSRGPGGFIELLGLLRTIGEGYRLSCMYRCQDALEAYLKLSHRQYNTGWVLSQVGKAYFELVDYYEADNAFSLARRVSPYTLEGMDIYSTVLYHLKEELKLSYVAQELISTDRLSHQAWCAIGNCYSLQKDHETALKNFQRAVHLDSKFAYAHTLCGHEYVALEDFESGVKCYQSALKVDPRHYNSWYGLGMVYFRQEKYEFAEHHFRKAFQINSRSSVLMCYLGMALHSLGRNEEAVELMEKAILADKKNPLPMYQKGNILFNLEKFDEALKVLEQLKECVPRESSVWALMGKIYKRLGIYDKAMFHYGYALDLKPSAADVAIIKAAIEKLHVPDELQEL